MVDRESLSASGRPAGGEPLQQIDFTEALLEAAAEEGIRRCVETCGHAEWRRIERIRGLVDLPADRWALLRHIIPPMAPPARPLNLYASGCPDTFLTEIAPPCDALDRWWTLAVLNWRDDNVRRCVSFADVPLPTDVDRFAVFELRTQRFLGIHSRGDEITVALPAHGTRVLRLAPWTGDAPVILGTDLHLTGGRELSNVTIEPGRITGAVDTKWQWPVTITAAFPAPDAPKVAQCTVMPPDREFAVMP